MCSGIFGTAWRFRYGLCQTPHTQMLTAEPAPQDARRAQASEIPIKPPTFVDIFAGCGGLSLGFLQAGWSGLFAIEKNSSPFETLKKNLLGDGSAYRFEWPDWLPQKEICAMQFVREYAAHARNLRGTVDALVGGPPCQGYSSAGKRDPLDPRNSLFETYLEFVELIQPKLILIENVRGMTLDFPDPSQAGKQFNYSQKLLGALAGTYSLHTRMLDLSRFGVPQSRTRFFVIGIRKDLSLGPDLELDPFEKVERERPSFLLAKALIEGMSAKAALSDLEVQRNGTVASPDSAGFLAIDYRSPITPYQRLMREGSENPPTDTRLANHRKEIKERFAKIISECHSEGRLNVSLSREAREAYGLKKQATRVLDPDRPAPTVTSMPDDLLHYREARALTVRENARLQAFPDWFSFAGQYTTGGHRRRSEVPRFTQVANAVPPLAAEAIGLSLKAYALLSSIQSGTFVMPESRSK